MKELENVAVFPHETSGRFNWSSVDATAVYAVHGENEVSDTLAQQIDQALSL